LFNWILFFSRYVILYRNIKNTGSNRVKNTEYCMIKFSNNSWDFKKSIWPKFISMRIVLRKAQQILQVHCTLTCFLFKNFCLTPDFLTHFSINKNNDKHAFQFLCFGYFALIENKRQNIAFKSQCYRFTSVLGFSFSCKKCVYCLGTSFNSA